MTNDPYAWDERARIHRDTPLYREYIQRLREGGDALLPFDDRALGELTDLDVLHLQCHIGTDTLSLARRGANAVGIDFSPVSIEEARSLGQELGLKATFLTSNVYTLPEHLKDDFDIVYTSYGVLCWLGDLKRWAEVAEGFVRPGGRLIVIDSHPLATAIADDGLKSDHVELDWPYFGAGTPLREDSPGTYADPTATNKMGVRWLWTHGLGDIVQAVLDTGLQLERLDEHADGFFPRHPDMMQNPDRTWRLPPPHHGRVPQTFTLIARKPQTP